MKYEQLEELVKNGESETLEFKKTTNSLTSACQTLCGFLNHGRGGILLFGVKQDGAVIGQDCSDSTLQKIANAIKKFEPQSNVKIDTVDSSNRKKVIVLEVIPTDQIPFTWDGRAWERIGNTTSLMPQHKFAALLIQRHHQISRWETEPASGVEVKNLDLVEIDRFISQGVQAGRIPGEASGDFKDILENSGLIDNNKVLRAAVVLFGFPSIRDYPQCQVNLARFNGIDKTEFIDHEQHSGHVFNLIIRSMNFLKKNLPKIARIIPEKLERYEELLFPPEALREALINAFCHRDYSVVGEVVNVAIYDDRVEISNPGSLPREITTDDLKKEHRSIPHNPLIAKIFYLRKYIERWGTGTVRIVKLCREAGHPEPIFISEKGEVAVKLLRKDYVKPDFLFMLFLDRSNTRQLEILMLLSKEKKLSRGELYRKLSKPLSVETLKKDLQVLKAFSLIDTEGYGRGSYWFNVIDDKVLRKFINDDGSLKKRGK